ncbi:MAG TPA: RNA polymerase sigma factor, partial [Rhodothermales bacterium]|nr:RNA polymerase sigma factor [Rhodothermales bacterium]
PRYDAARPFATWAYRIALNVGISHLRRDSLRRGLVTPYDAHGPEPTDAATLTPEADDRVRALHAVMDRLDPFDRALLVLHLEGYSNPEVGEILGLTATNASTRLSRLRARLRALLDPDAPRPDAP